MSNIIKCREDLMLYIKSVILKYCPYTEDRLSILGSSKSPELAIKININNNDSQIMSMFGNSNFKSGVTERVTTSYIISFDEIGDIINFILDDHEAIKDINFYDKELDLKFAINWTDKSIKGINCGEGIIKEYSKRLTKELGRGYSITNLKYMRQYYLYQKSQPLADQLSWSMKEKLSLITVLTI